MQTRLIQVLARQQHAELHRDAAARRRANAADREEESVPAIAIARLFGRLRARLSDANTRTEPAERELRPHAFPLWHAVKAGLARSEAGVEAAEEIVEAGFEAVEHAIEGCQTELSISPSRR
jgi:hypothetical protein